MNRIALAAFVFVMAVGKAGAYGPVAHEIVGGIADKLIANTPASRDLLALTDGMTLERVSTIPDEIKAWDRDGPDDPNTYPSYPEHRKIDNQLREFWRANPPTHDAKSPMPSHHWFHYTDVPALNSHKYADGKTGRSQWDIVHMIAYCVGVLRGEVAENNERKITKSLAIILITHFAADIHEPLHVGAEYFDESGRAVDPDKGQPGLPDEGGNTIMLRLHRGTPEALAKRGLKLHGFWDGEAVLANLPGVSSFPSKEQHYRALEKAKRGLIDQMVKTEPSSWRVAANVALAQYPEQWADDIMPIAREAHERLRFFNVRPQVDQDRTVAGGIAEEKAPNDRIVYADWAAGIVRGELHKAGWRLADLLSQALTTGSTTSRTETPPPAGTPTPSVAATPNAAVSTMPMPSPPAATESEFGDYPANYKEIVTTWLEANGLGNAHIDWQGEPKPADVQIGPGQHVYGYSVIFNTADGTAAKTRSVIIRDGKIVERSGF